jgi:hypothetical protein
VIVTTLLPSLGADAGATTVAPTTTTTIAPATTTTTTAAPTTAPTVVAAASTPAPAVDTTPAAPARTVPVTGVPTDCSVDVSARIQAVIDAAPDGSTLQFTPGACYRIDNTITVRDRSGLTFAGNGATFRQVTNGSELRNPSTVRARAAWLFVRGTDLTMQDTIVIGANPAAGMGERAYQPKFEGQAAYWIQGSHDTLLDRVQAYDTYGDFVYVAPGTDGLLVRNSTFSRNGRQGWTINGSNITFDHNTISETRRATIDIEPTYANWTTRNVTISNNVVGHGRGYFLANKGSGQAIVDGVSILNNELRGKTMQILSAAAPGKHTNYRIIGNRSNMVLSGYGGPFVFHNVTNLQISFNRQITQNSHPLRGASLKGAVHVVIAGNEWLNAKGVWLDRGGNVDVRQGYNWIGRPLSLAAPSITAGPTAGPATS